MNLIEIANKLDIDKLDASRIKSTVRLLDSINDNIVADDIEVTEELDLSSGDYLQYVYPRIQGILEPYLFEKAVPMKQRIEITSDTSNIICFLLKIKDIDEATVARYYTNILYRFHSIEWMSYGEGAVRLLSL
ncbi:MAG: hypothetical protein TR69_WS6001001060 [candidate division WS6 bacterium OLB20]|uniref:Uncharacterized protein n=1 Tax=candidate division WS6 bacterium OLB20 TaxID=1617426 RepID=A0A136LZF1_9BACT|nr:MAG: hypothetical protein TR69_WS6001001060 [candidate division WS6 bacterium OLB20]